MLASRVICFSLGLSVSAKSSEASMKILWVQLHMTFGVQVSALHGNLKHPCHSYQIL